MLVIVVIVVMMVVVAIVAIVVNVRVVNVIVDIVYVSENGLVMSLLREVWVRPKSDEMNLATTKLPTTTNNTGTGG